MANPSVTWLTQETYDRLKAELDELAVNGREEIAKRIEEAREDGDLKENAGYHAAKDEQGKIEARINQLETMLKNSEVREAPEASGIVETGTVVTAKIGGKEQKFLLGSREMASQTQLRVYSGESPLGASILGLAIGASTSYEAPNGNSIDVEITEVETFHP
ncbi:transcription elongation factor GreA [Pseudoclavibacter sp. RFBJ3]|uniref:transcription elongation factor GreA n=1 Tax=unclassified Pseudoclavibacter TaxID=2615177 RepID=UPI000CE8429F|nr:MULTISPECIES: transcription elongation factor GreA [unclassified Pseudoclavibacter]MBF4459839.1 transcription elongation factor GreA [Pseudoclavibacter sp. VKM Ac-2867]MBF4549816.1 transcription elongation factor GreA [Pseudoclavibacter sp. VKM Ac-2888]PPF39694.1 transcription elongation factor GreA [Pseudoclavibacter sp. AY1H1]PPF76230.1 transcription elongation factor GreA [Pseudoclavibacter sp. Z016]PPF84686.1 transcription elongation factor GreA [Pseudoclavibacter sp. RFBJ5]